jgi:predicted metal-dependent phosphoesterase TrpH
MFKVDLHTHSSASPDGSLTIEDYRAMLAGGRLDCVAVTDHDTVTMALRARSELGDKLIVGEEISTADGEIIGLFLREKVTPGLSLGRTVELIHKQGGLVYVPHPFETIRHGLSLAALETVAEQVDIMEVFNGRAVAQNRSSDAKQWAADHAVVAAASSDAHGLKGWGRTYSLIEQLPNSENLTVNLRAAKLVEQSVGVCGVLYPKFNRLRKRVSK